MAHVFGLTGGIASGKSTVASILRERGIPVVDADQVARDVVAPGTPGLEAIVERFGEEVIDDNGELDRKRLGDLVFGDEESRLALEAITHPRIATESMRRLMAAMAQGSEIVFYEAALLVETGRFRDFAALVVVSAPEAAQLERLMSRDGLSRDAARSRIDSQMPLDDKIACADFVIENVGTVNALNTRVDELLDWASARANGAAK